MTPESPKLTIAIDGPAASGKSTTAQLVARALGYTYLDTGAMYRAVTAHLLDHGISTDDEAAAVLALESCPLELRYDPDGTQRVWWDRHDVTEVIRDPLVTRHVSAVAAMPGIRRRLVDLQRQLGAGGGVVLDGRDIGTVVFPDAEVKVFMVADVHARAERRARELVERGYPADVDAIALDLERRDAFDAARSVGPLRKADGALELDTSRLTIADQVAHVLEAVRRKKAEG